MIRLSISYTCKYEVNFASNYKFTICGICINARTNRVIKKVYNSGCLGYNIGGKFYSLTYLRRCLVKIKEVKLPF
jgi:hypothetical protein